MRLDTQIERLKEKKERERKTEREGEREREREKERERERERERGGGGWRQSKLEDLPSNLDHKMILSDKDVVRFN